MISLWSHPCQSAIDEGLDALYTLVWIEFEGVAKVTKLQMLSILVHQYVCAFEVSMNGTLTVEIFECLQDLFDVVSTQRFLNSSIGIETLLDDTPARHILQIDTEDVVLYNFAAKILHYILVLETLIPINLLLDSLGF